MTTVIWILRDFKPITDLNLNGENMPEERITGSKIDLDLSASIYSRLQEIFLLFRNMLLLLTFDWTTFSVLSAKAISRPSCPRRVQLKWATSLRDRRLLPRVHRHRRSLATMARCTSMWWSCRNRWTSSRGTMTRTRRAARRTTRPGTCCPRTRRTWTSGTSRSAGRQTSCPMKISCGPSNIRRTSVRSPPSTDTSSKQELELTRSWDRNSMWVWWLVGLNLGYQGLV